MPDYTLDLIGQIMMEMRAEMRDRFAQVDRRFEAVDLRFDRIDERLNGVEATINRHQDELTVTTAMVMRHASEPIAWGAMERQIKNLAERLAAVERRLPQNDA